MDTAPEDAQSSPGETPRQASQRQALAGLRQMREAIMKGRDLPPRDDVQPPLDWHLHERRLLAMEEIIRHGTTRADGERFQELEQEFFLDYHAGMARLMAAVQESMVRNDFSLCSAPFGLRLCHGLAVRSILGDGGAVEADHPHEATPHR